MDCQQGAKPFNVGEYRRKACNTEDCESQFFSPFNKTGSKIREYVLLFII
ncbi:unnamed protein product, partial [Gongylonema pulchrum]